jgi:hypothetical protein
MGVEGSCSWRVFGLTVTTLPPGVPAGSGAFDRVGASAQFGKGAGIWDPSS